MNTSYFSNGESTETIISTFIGSSEHPFYIIDLSSVTEQYTRWKTHLPRVKPHYAVKCNPDPRIIKLLGKLGCNFDCASRNEMDAVTSLQVNPSRIIFSNPCKQKSHIDHALSSKIYRMTFDSISELSKISPDSEAQLIIRIRVDDSQSVCRFGSKFGCSLAELDDIYTFAKKAKYKLTGVNFHVGSNCRDPETYHKAIKDARRTFDKAKEYGFNFDTLDIGGGFPSDLETFAVIAQTVNVSLDTYFKETPNIIAEPGRYMVEKSHTLVVSVITVKSDRRYYINEGVYGSFNCVHFDHAYPVFLPYTLKSDKLLYKKSTVFGPTCDSMDVLGDSYLLPDLSVGDRLYVENVGAYTCAASSNFNGFNAPTRYYIIKTLV